MSFDVNFSFSREPSTKISTQIAVSGLVPADNDVVLIGQMAASGASATANVPVTIENFGDLDALQTEVDGLFGSGAKVGEMVMAAARAVQFSDLDPVALPTVRVIPMPNSSPDLAATLAANDTLPMPFVATDYKATDADDLSDFKDHLVAISKSDRGPNAQFGSFGFIADDESLATMTPIAEGVARPEVVIPWLRDQNASVAQDPHEVAAAVCALCAANPFPFNPLNGIKVGGLVPPTDRSDYHTVGDSGTVATGLEAGLLPLTVDNGSNVRISRSVTASRRVTGIADSSYFDLQDWQTIYLIRKNIYNLAQQPRYKQAKASDEKAQAFRSEVISSILKPLDGTVLQKVDELADLFVYRRAEDNRSAFIFTIPLNVIPGFHNKGVGLIGTDLFDVTVIL